MVKWVIMIQNGAQQMSLSVIKVIHFEKKKKKKKKIHKLIHGRQKKGRPKEDKKKKRVKKKKKTFCFATKRETLIYLCVFLIQLVLALYCPSISRQFSFS